MHGRVKAERKEETDEQKRVKLRKIGKYRKLTAAALAGHEAQKYDEEAVKLTSKIIELNPDYYTLWNYRKSIVLDEAARDGASGEALGEREFALVERALRRNPKSYCAWAHRLWTLRRGWGDPRAELRLCAKFLDLDARNFHCWGYRAQVAAMVPDARRDFDFCTAKIGENFSNYSAWHYRSKLAPSLLAALPGDEERHGMVDAEFELLRQAFVTEPDDQSAWLYHRWLVQLSAGGQPERHAAVVRRELAMCDELLALEPECKWAMLARLHLLEGRRGQGKADGDDVFRREAGRVLDALEALDPLRRNYYGAMRQRIIAVA